MASFEHEQAQYWHESEHLGRRDPRHRIIRTYVEGKLKFIRDHIGLPSSPEILDVGAGNGYFSYYWDKLGRTVATDYSEVMLRKNPVADKRVMDARKLEFPDNSFDITFCHALLHHIDRNDRVKVLKEMARVSRRSVAFIEPNGRNPLVAAFSIVKKEERGGLDFSYQYCRRIAEEAGLKIVKSCTWGALTPNRMPFSGALLPFFRTLERPLPLGVTNVVIAGKE